MKPMPGSNNPALCLLGVLVLLLCPPGLHALCLKPRIPNGQLSVEKDQYVNSETVTVQCNPGYTLVGSQNIFCSEKESWSPDVPTCEREVPEHHGIILSGKNLLRCLPNSQDIKLALELNKVSVEIKNLEQERNKEKKSI